MKNQSNKKGANQNRVKEASNEVYDSYINDKLKKFTEVAEVRQLHEILQFLSSKLAESTLLEVLWSKMSHLRDPSQGSDSVTPGVPALEQRGNGGQSINKTKEEPYLLPV